jgi:hypothetical protein
MKTRLAKAVQKPIHREHLRTASIIVLLEVLTAFAIPRMFLSTVTAVMVFAWDLIFIILDQDTDGTE